MAKNIFATIALVVALAIALEAAPSTKSIGKERPGFIYLGAAETPTTITRNGVQSVILEEHYYWQSVNAAGYAEAQRDCRANGDSLLEIETQEELDAVEAFLQDTDQTAVLHWVGGKYQVGSKKFTWEGGADIIDSFWEAGQPSQSKPNSRIVANTYGQIVQLRAQANTVTSRYICEGV